MPDAPLTIENLLDELVVALPELEPDVVAEWNDPENRRDDGTIALHIVFWDGVFPLVEMLITAEDRTPEETELLRRAFAFFERMLESTDADVLDVAQATVAEDLSVHAEMEALYPIMPPQFLARVQAWRSRD